MTNASRESSASKSMDVPIGLVAVKTSKVVLVISLLSLSVSLSSGFNLINPIFALLITIAAIGFYLMGRMIQTAK